MPPTLLTPGAGRFASRAVVSLRAGHFRNWLIAVVAELRSFPWRRHRARELVAPDMVEVPLPALAIRRVGLLCAINRGYPPVAGLPRTGGAFRVTVSAYAGDLPSPITRGEFAAESWRSAPVRAPCAGGQQHGRRRPSVADTAALKTWRGCPPALTRTWSPDPRSILRRSGRGGA